MWKKKGSKAIEFVAYVPTLPHIRSVQFRKKCKHIFHIFKVLIARCSFFRAWPKNTHHHSDLFVRLCKQNCNSLRIMVSCLIEFTSILFSRSVTWNAFSNGKWWKPIENSFVDLLLQRWLQKCLPSYYDAVVVFFGV